MATVVAGGAEDCACALPVHTYERGRLVGTLDCIDCGDQITAGAVLEPHCNAQAAGKISMNLALGGSGSDTRPTHQ